jgi:hypothetical protein
MTALVFWLESSAPMHCEDLLRMFVTGGPPMRGGGPSGRRRETDRTDLAPLERIDAGRRASSRSKACRAPHS